MQVNLQNVQESEWIDMPGRYTLFVASVEHKQINGNTWAEYECRDTMTGSKIRAGFPLTEKALWNLKKFARACGGEVGAGFDTESLVGKTFVGDVEMERSEKGKSYARLKGYAPAGSVTGVAPASAPRPASAPTGTGNNTNDDLPF